MASDAQIKFLQDAFTAATIAKHPWPDAAAAEACAESAWGTSKSVSEGNNLLGIHAPSWWQGGTFVETTQEQSGDHMYTDPDAKWSSFASWTECFRCQVEILNRNKIYLEALVAKDATTYIQQVSAQWALTDKPIDNSWIFKFNKQNYIWISARWSTGHSRAYTVLQIWNAHHDKLIPLPNTTISIA